MSDEHDVQPPPPTVVMAQLLDGFLLSQALFVLADAGVATILDEEGPRRSRPLRSAQGLISMCSLG